MCFATDAAFALWIPCSRNTTPAISGLSRGAKKVNHPWSRRFLVLLEALVRPLPPYGAQSYLILEGGRVIERGWIAVADGRIAEFGEGSGPAGSEDVAGDLIMPGLIELHTDHLEAHYVPRPKVFWDPIAAVLARQGGLGLAPLIAQGLGRNR